VEVHADAVVRPTLVADCLRYWGTAPFLWRYVCGSFCR